MSNGGPTFPPPGTPENPSMEGPAPVFQLATWLQRVGGAFIDGIIIWAILLVGMMLSGGDTGGLLYGLASLVATGFGIWQLWQQGVTGQTIGKRVMSLKVVNEAAAQPIGGPFSIARAVLHLLDWFPCFIGFLFPIWDSKRQTFADKIAKTVVITTR